MAYQLHRQLLELSDDCVKQLDLDGRIRSVNEPGLRLLGASAAELEGRSWEVLWPIAGRPAVQRACAAARQGQATRFIGETIQGERRRWWTVFTGPLRDEHGTVVGIGAVSRDISDRLQFEDAMDMLNARLQHRLDRAERSVRTGDEHAAALEAALDAATEAVEEGHAAQSSLREKLDLAEVARLAAEQIALQTQKSAAVGQMVAGLAHDFNNNLQTIMTALETLAASPLEMTAQQARYFSFAEQAARLASVNVRRLLAFSRSHPYAPEHRDLGALLDEVLPLIIGTLGSRFTVQAVRSDAALPVFADPHAFHQALMNLAMNARDACGGAGRIALRTGREVIPVDGADEGAHPDYVYVELSDDGDGMSEDVLARVFEPFFTTKAAGKGTGLGLAQVLGFAQQAGGTSRILSEVGAGTTVRLVFPRAHAATTA
ncbi:two-component system sensor histidine kinase NtrB [Luteibacter sp.]|uniref:two-component system sensor histidine kinase NtrB n=1 Tax=Luteibacter sp. TaxID=1886636 RepID=UPI003F7E93C3